MNTNIHDRAKKLVYDSHGERTLAEAYAELSRRAHNARRYGKLRVPAIKAADFAAVEKPTWYAEESFR